METTHAVSQTRPLAGTTKPGGGGRGGGHSLGPTMRYSAPSRVRVALPTLRLTNVDGRGLNEKVPRPGP